MTEKVQSEDDDPLVLAVGKCAACREVTRHPGKLLFVVDAPIGGGEVQVLRTRFMGDYGSICQLTLFKPNVEQPEVTFAPTACVVDALRKRGAVGIEALCLEWIAKGKR